jgi:hypothetical protein
VTRLWRAGRGGSSDADTALPSFCDMGCGRGLAVALAARSKLVGRCGGVEKDPRWVEAARVKLRDVHLLSPAGEGDDRVWVSEGDVRDAVWWKGVEGIAFVHGSTWTLELQSAVWNAAASLPPGSLLATVSWKAHRTPLFELCDESPIDMGWGKATIRTYRRLRIGRWAGKLFSPK